MTQRLSVLLLSLLLVLPAAAAPKRRAVAKPAPVDITSPEGWLIANARPLSAVELVPFDHDLEPLRPILGDATIVALGDGTHGTHEFFTVKLRVIDFLVRKLGFDLVAFEGPYSHYDRINDYVLGGAGDPTALLHEMADELGYVFWEAEEIRALIEWMRIYNAHRGDAPPVQIAGADIFGQVDAWKDVVAYLRNVDPVAAVSAETDYACIGDNELKGGCGVEAKRVHDALVPREAELIAKSSLQAYRDALQSARVVVQAQNGLHNLPRDKAMADNLLWMRDRHSSTGRIVYWAHNDHVSKGPTELGAHPFPAGDHLEHAIGTSYFAIGTMTAAGSYRQWERIPHDAPLTTVVKNWPALRDGAYETYFRLRRLPNLIIPLRGTLPQWLVGPAHYNTAGVAFDPAKQPASLPDKFDAVIFIDTTSAVHPLP